MSGVERVSRLRVSIGVAATLVAALAVGVPGASAFGGASGSPLEISSGPGPTVVAGSGCNWPEGETYGPGSEVAITVTTWFAGDGRTTTPVTLGEADVVPSSAGGWEYIVPNAPLAAVPSWATEVIVGAEAHCSQAIGNGFDYDPAESRRAIDRQAGAATTTTTNQPAPTNGAAPAQPVSGTATLTG